MNGPGMEPPHERAQAVPLVISPLGLGFVIGPAAAGWLHDATGSYSLALFGASACLATAATLCTISLCMHRIQPAAAVNPPALRAVVVAEPEAAVAAVEMARSLTERVQGA